eukprot:2557591-Rhodomonas_salina.2
MSLRPRAGPAIGLTTELGCCSNGVAGVGGGGKCHAGWLSDGASSTQMGVAAEGCRELGLQVEGTLDMPDIKRPSPKPDRP